MPVNDFSEVVGVGLAIEYEFVWPASVPIVSRTMFSGHVLPLLVVHWMMDTIPLLQSPMGAILKK